MDERNDDKDAPRALTYNELLVLQALTSGSEYGFEVMDVTGLSAGTVYPVLRRLEARGQVTSAKEDEAAAHAEGRPARRVHGLTAAGHEALARARDKFGALHARLGLIP